MAFSFDEYEDFAKGLKDSPKEVDLRNSVSRGYYCFFHKIRRFLGYSSVEKIDHHKLITELRVNGFTNLSKGMQIMKEEREQADYNLKNNPGKTSIEFKANHIEMFWNRYDYLVKLIGKVS